MKFCENSSRCRHVDDFGTTNVSPEPHLVLLAKWMGLPTLVSTKSSSVSINNISFSFIMKGCSLFRGYAVADRG